MAEETKEKPEEKKPEKDTAPKNPPEVPEETIDKSFNEDLGQERVKGDFTSPMALIMFTAAGIVDLIGFILVFMLIDDFGILDITGLLIVGGLMFFHARAVTASMEAQAKIVGRRVLAKTGLGTAGKASKLISLLGKNENKIKAFTKLSIKTIIWTFLIELCPYLGALLPTWIIAVYRHLKES